MPVADDPPEVPTLAIVSSMATRHLLEELARVSRDEAGCGIALRAMGGVEAARRVRAGEAADVVVLAADVIAALEDEGHLIVGQHADLVRSGIAAAVRAGAVRPPIDTEAALRQAVLEAGRIGYSTGPSGTHLLALWERWGIAETIADRLVQAPPGQPVGGLVARGEVDLGFQQTSELLGLPGIDILGPLPGEAQSVTTFTAGIAASSTEPQQAAKLIAWLASSETADAKRRSGMEPA